MSKKINFTAYEKIANSATHWQIDESSSRLFSKTDWVVTEKLHGANFCVMTDGVILRCAKRKRLLDEGERFFHHHTMLKRIQKQVKAAFVLVKERYAKTKWVMIYGELFGGSYPHPDVTPDPDPAVQAVQTGVYYSPTIAFYAFDIAYQEGQEASTRCYLNYDQALEIFQTIHLFHAQPLFIGKWHDANRYAVGFDSTIPALLSLPPLPQPNPAEGIIIKPVTSIVIETKKGQIRPIIKKKIAQFAEDKRFHQAQKWPTEQSRHSNDALSMLKWEAFNLVTENRLLNAISKVGIREGEERKQSRILFNMLVADVYEELSARQDTALHTLTSEEEAQWRRYLYEQVRQLFKLFF